MAVSSVQLDLMEFVERNILPRYNQFDRAHNMAHVIRVIKRALVLAEKIGADVNMAYVAAAYHDLGLEGPRAIHHITSGKILMADQRLRKWFTKEQIVTLKEAVEDHRASSSRSPRSVYGKITAEADRDLEPEMVFRRTVQYGLTQYPELSKEAQWERFERHLNEKYSTSGYIKLWIPGSINEQYLNEIRNILPNKVLLRQWFDRLFEEETR